MKNRISRIESQPLDTLLWAEQNLRSLARHSAARICGGELDSIHLAATFGLLKAKQQIRSALSEVATLREAAR